MVKFISGVSGFGYIKANGRYITVFGDSETVAYILPYTTKLQAKKLAKKLTT
jgi:hypothetical protein